MFKEWGFLLGEIWILLLLAALLGLLAGWLFWSRRSGGGDINLQGDYDRLKASNAQLSDELADCRAKGADLQAQLSGAGGNIASAAVGAAAGASMSGDGEWEGKYNDLRASYDKLKGELADCRSNGASLKADLDACKAKTASLQGQLDKAPVVSTPAEPSKDEISKNINEMMAEDYDGDGILEGANEGTRPEALDGPRGGKADDLKQIKGVGVKMEQLCNKLGFYHFDQIAGWSRDEVAWVDANLEGFKGRVTRDTWVDQAKVLAAGGTTEFSKKVKKGDVGY